MTELEQGGMKIGETRRFGEATVERRMNDYMAYVGDDKTRWESGQTIDDAIGKLVVSHPELEGRVS